MTRLLIVEDDGGLRRTLTISFSARHFEVDAAPDARTALTLVASPPDLILMDLGLPDVDGIELIGQLRERTGAPIIVVSARHAQHHKIDALDAGADDYVTKPFGVEELVARVRAALRRPDLVRGDQNEVRTEAFTLDLAAKRAERRGVPVSLTPTEWHLAEVLVRHRGELVPAADLLTAVWGPASAKERHLLRIHIGHLRHKLEDDPAHPRHFVTVQGLGYRFEP
nr:response regulator transcription factor [Propionibacterium sp.]